MTFIDEFKDMFTDTVIWKPLVSRDRYGKPTFHATGYAYMARLVRHTKMVRNKDAQMVASTAQVWMGPAMTSGDPVADVSPEDQLLLSDGKTPPIISVDKYQDEKGDTHETVNFV